MMRKIIFITTAFCAMTTPAYATKITAPGMNCALKETVSVGINFNTVAVSMAEAKAKIDEKMSQIRNFASQQKIENLEPQSMNYSINSQNYNNAEKTYAVSGNMQYQMPSTEIAFKFADFLEKQKLNVNINSNAYRQGNCNQ